MVGYDVCILPFSYKYLILLSILALQEVNKSLKGTLDIVGLNVDKFPAIDFKKMYKVGFAPKTASQTAKAIHRYLNRDYRGF